jgi:uncharacterized membrane protein (DUF4010 family)
MTSRVTKPSSVARHGTIAGTHVRVRAVRGPSAIGWNSGDDAACSAVGHSACGSSCFRRSGGCHILRFLYHTRGVEPYEEHIALGTAVAVGLLIGLEREQTRPENATRGLFAGVRTYPIVALIGGLATMLEAASMWLPLIALAGVIALVAISYAADLRDGGDHGVTTEVSVIATYLLGALATSRGAVEPMATRLVLVAALGVAITFLLSSKRWFHSFATRVSREDFYSTVQFLLVAVVVLPLLPRRELGPLDAINPFNVGLMVVMIAGLSFVGYVAIRILGPGRGLLASAALGGLVSSTAVTVSFAGRTKQDPKLAPIAAGAIAVASTIMLVRVAILVTLVDVAILPTLAIPLAAMVIGALVGGLLTFRRDHATTPEAANLKNPFELGNAIRFGLLFGLILLASKAATVYLGDRGLYAASAIAGTTDVDAITLSTATLATGGLDIHVAAFAILIAVAVNTAVKTGLAMSLGGSALGRRALVIGGLIVAGGIVGLVASWALI